MDQQYIEILIKHDCTNMFGDQGLVWSHPYLPIIFMFDPFKMHVKGWPQDIVPESPAWLDNVLTVLEVMTG